jgi:hypothetical protein
LTDPQPKNYGSPRKCGFNDFGMFTSDNWACGTLMELRPDFDTPQRHGDDDQNLYVIPTDGCFIILGVYKSRGATEFATLVNGSEQRALTLEMCERVLDGKGPIDWEAKNET